jgi:hypothetical protein
MHESKNDSWWNARMCRMEEKQRSKLALKEYDPSDYVWEQLDTPIKSHLMADNDESDEYTQWDHDRCIDYDSYLSSQEY